MTNDAAFVGVDIGGTFTDVILLQHDRPPVTSKVLTRHDDYCASVVDGIMSAVKECAPGTRLTRVVHATTLGSNTLLSGTGAATGLITTSGFRDVLEIGRLRRPTLYDTKWRKPPPLVPRWRRLEVEERIGAKGEVLVEPSEAEVAEVADRLVESGIGSLAVCCLNAYVNPANEHRIKTIVTARHPGLTVCASHEILREIKEYERFSTTVVNAYLAPIFHDYLSRLVVQLRAMEITASLLMMQSSGGLIPSRLAAEQPVRIIESGPAAGALAAARLAQSLRVSRAISLDIGGTTAKAAVIESGRPRISYEYEVGPGIHQATRLFGGNGYPVKVPAVDIAEIGAGGGSIARLDAAGAMHVGPLSAGSTPGPAAYGRGGTDATLTDANLVLGYLNPTGLAGGALRLRRDLAAAAIERLCEAAGDLAIEEAAYAIQAVASSNMIRAIRAVTTEVGLDPAHYTMISFGGAGGLQCAAVARHLGISRVLVPEMAGLYSAWGLLSSDIVYDEVQTLLARLEDLDPERLTALIESALQRVRCRLEADQLDAEHARLRILADLRYRGQSSELTVPLEPETANRPADMARRFEDQYRSVYGEVGRRSEIELVNVRIAAEIELIRGFSGNASPSEARLTGKHAADRREAYFGTEVGWRSVAVFPGRAALGHEPQAGPLIVEDPDTTILVLPGDVASLDSSGNVNISTLQDASAEKIS